MAARKSTAGKKFFTVAEANATLPLVRAIVKDVTELAPSLRDRHERLTRFKSRKHSSGSAYEEELEQVREAYDRDLERMKEYLRELENLGVELKDYYTGLIDFPCWMDGREVYLCWRLGEPQVAHWHELEAGFAGRQRLRAVQTGKT
jgi:hypothetical protein